ncbi:MAG: DEAD/DEAH box helicase [Deltaproteobacteria bacterium]|nr:MAG: DEAD/DEAH box helicase [Deltaproteobacteria bacterium]
MRPVQEKALERLRTDRDGLITASTGSGKTEAAFLPVVEALLDRPREGGKTRALVLSPTRALASDLHRRMAPVLEALGLRLDVATSDKNTVRDNEVTDVLIRTPEGLDITLCRRPGELSDITEVLIDEIHDFLKGPRGTQTAGLLARLDMSGVKARRIGISATIPDLTLPSRSRLLRDPIIIEDGDQQGLDVSYYDWVRAGREGGEAFVDFLRELGSRKLIGFARSKRRVEDLCGWLSTGFLRENCMAHHASLSSSGRRAVEERLRKARVGLVVATTTLEVGIDIGDVDTCVLFDAPSGVSSFLQRAGRAGRRSGLRRVVCVGGLFDRTVEYAKLVAQISGGLPPGTADARPFLVGALQQLASYAAIATGRSRAEIRELASTAFGMSARAADAMVDGLVRGDLLVARGDSIELSARGEQLVENRAIHLTFGVDTGSPVYDESSGRQIGKAYVHGTSEIRLGGSGRKVIGVDGLTGRVITRPTGSGNASFAPASASVFEALAGRIVATIGGEARV